MKVLISDKLKEEAIDILQNNGFNVVKKFSITNEELKHEIENYEAIIIRSRTKLTADVLENAKKLKVIGRAGVGLDNIDLKKAEELNIKVLNTPEAPSISVAELTIGLLLSSIFILFIGLGSTFMIFAIALFALIPLNYLYIKETKDVDLTELK